MEVLPIFAMSPATCNTSVSTTTSKSDIPTQVGDRPQGRHVEWLNNLSGKPGCGDNTSTEPLEKRGGAGKVPTPVVCPRYEGRVREFEKMHAQVVAGVGRGIGWRCGKWLWFVFGQLH